MPTKKNDDKLPIPEYLLFSYAQSGIEKAKEILFYRYEGTILKVVSDFINKNKKLYYIEEDLRSAGKVGLLKAIKSHNYLLGGQEFERLAFYYVKKEMIAEMKTLKEHIKIQDIPVKDDKITVINKEDMIIDIENRLKAKLTKFELSIFYDYHGINGEKLSINQICKKYKISKHRFRKIIKIIDEKVKEAFADY